MKKNIRLVDIMKNENLTNIGNMKKKETSNSFFERLEEISMNITFPEELFVTFEYMTVFPIHNYEQSQENGIDSLIEELTKLSGKIHLPLKFFGNVYLNFRITNRFKSKEFKKTKEKSYFLIIESTSIIDVVKFARDTKSDTTNTGNLKPEFLAPSIYRLYYSACLTNFLYMTQIAYPGSLWLGEAVIYSKKNKIGNIEGISSVLTEYDYSKSKWPRLENISIKEVWKYIIDNTHILKEFSKTKIERAFNSYTYLFTENHHNNIPASLFWAISGLECLFVSGDTGITQQLNEKIQTFLGEITENKRLFKKLYNYRSGLIHGDLSIPIKNGLLNEEKHIDDLYDMNSLAAVVLVASLQKIVKENIKELTFKYTYE